MEKKQRLPKLEKLATKDDLRRGMQHIQFSDDGYCVVTNGFVLARWNYHQSFFVDKEFRLENIEGRLLHATQWEMLRKLKGPYILREDGISAQNNQVLIRWAPIVEDEKWSGKFPKWRHTNLFEVTVAQNRDGIFALNAYQMASILDCFNFTLVKGLVIQPIKDKCIVRPYDQQDYNWGAIIMNLVADLEYSTTAGACSPGIR